MGPGGRFRQAGWPRRKGPGLTGAAPGGDLAPAQTDTPASEAPSAPASGRLSAVDVFRGLTITEVVGHHTSGMALRYATPGTPEYEALSVLNRSLHFAVPAFVFLSVAILTNSLLKRFDARRYFWRRLTRGLWPYLLWSALYVLWSVWTGQRPP